MEWEICNRILVAFVITVSKMGEFPSIVQPQLIYATNICICRKQPTKYREKKIKRKFKVLMYPSTNEDSRKCIDRQITFNISRHPLVPCKMQTSLGTKQQMQEPCYYVHLFWISLSCFFFNLFNLVVFLI